MLCEQCVRLIDSAYTIVANTKRVIVAWQVSPACPEGAYLTAVLARVS